VNWGATVSLFTGRGLLWSAVRMALIGVALLALNFSPRTGRGVRIRQ
jgi:hypothetical protein